MNLKRPKRSITLGLPEVFRSKGGIQRFGTFLLKAVAEFCIGTGTYLRALSLNDVYSEQREIPKLVGANRNKIRFTLDSIKSALSSDLFLIGHVNLSPVGLIASILKPSLRYGVVTYGIDCWDIKGTLTKMAMRKANAIISPSRFTREKLELQGFATQKLFTLPAAVDGNIFYPAPPSQRLIHKHNLAGKKVLLTVGRLARSERYKGHRILFEALKDLRKEFPGIVLIIVGEGDDRESLQKLVRVYGLGHHVIFAGIVSDNQLREYYNTCDLFVMPSKMEGFGIVYLEALACGKPVIAGNKNGSRDALLDGELGILIDPDDPKQLLRAMVKIISRDINHRFLDPSYLRETVLSNFGYERFSERVVQMLWRLLPN
jgi:glycosyltransferase involved in cell wall biosynthesis